MISVSAGNIDCIDPTSPIALYWQLGRVLQRRIESGWYKLGDRFSEAQGLEFTNR